MRISFDDIEIITVGAVRIEQHTDGIHFYKCTQKQVDAWKSLGNDLYQRSLTTTGVRLDFYTNSKALDLSVTSGDKFDIYVDGVFRKQYITDKCGRHIHFDVSDVLNKTQDNARITIYFPAHSVGVINALELEDDSDIAPAKHDTKMLFIGDSITQGWNSGYDSLSYAQRVSRFFNANSIIHGVGGGFYHESIVDSIGFAPDTVFIAFGMNDFTHYHSEKELSINVLAFMDRIKEEYKNAKNIFAISPTWRSDFDTSKTEMKSYDSCRQTIIEQINSHGFIHIDGLTLVPPCPEFYADKTLHPNALGFGIYAENLIKQIIKYI